MSRSGPPFTVTGKVGPLVAVALHAGHDLRAEVADAMALDDATRRREEDPGTERLTDVASLRAIAHRSRFEVDLNRARDGAVYAGPDEAWGLEPWRRPLPHDVVARSLEIHDAFYAAMSDRLDDVAASTPFVVLDVHSYNHRRAGPDRTPAPAAGNPAVNVGTGSLDRARWGHVVDRFMSELGGQEVDGHRLDVRENVRFRGGYFARWVNDRYRGRGCALALEFKKVFMDEWTGEIDDGHVRQLRHALAAVVPAVLREVEAGRP